MAKDDDRNIDTQIVDISESLDADATQSLVGRTVAGKYHILRKLARGGMGVVYVAEHTGLAREVVFKVLSYHLSNDNKAKSRFEREARGLSVLDHPNVVTVHDFGHEDGLTYIVMEYVPGENLSQRLRRRGRIPYDDLLPIFLQTIDALAAAHEKGIVHRDVKPSNIMITKKAGRDDFVKVLDFGLAKLASTSVDITKGNLVGTVSYLAPEVIKGDEATPASDVYSLGVMFYYLMSGSKPFEASDDMSVLYQHVNVIPDRLDEVVPAGEAPTEFIDFIHRCIEKDPADRPSDAGEMREILNARLTLPSISSLSIDSAAAIPRYRPPDSSAETLAPDRPIRQTSPPMRPLSGTYDEMRQSDASMSRSISIERVRTRNRRRVAIIAFTTAALGLVLYLTVVMTQQNPRVVERIETVPVEEGPGMEFGLFEIHTTPPGRVSVDGEAMGTTPAELPIGPGKHTVVVSADGYEDWEQTLEMTQGEHRRVDVFLPPAPTKTPTAVDAGSTPAPPPAERPKPPPPRMKTPTPNAPVEPAPKTADQATDEVKPLPNEPRDKGGLLSVEEQKGGLLRVE